MERAKILGLDVDLIGVVEAVDYAYNTRGQVVTINPEMINFAQQAPDFAQIVNDAQLVIPDGIGVEIGLKLLGNNIKRIPGIEFGKALIDKFSTENKAIAMIGAKPGVAQKASENLGIEPVYIHDGYFDDENRIISELVAKNPELVLVALGSPKQEFFIYKLKNIMPNSLMIGLGGSFDVWAGNVKRAPKIYQNLGLEWLYRTIKEPKRFKRIFPTLPVFMLKVLRERLFCK